MADAPNIGAVITNPFARKVIYGTYVIALTLAGAVQVAYAATTGGSQPEWLTVAVAVIGYLGVPVGALALANSPSKAQEEAFVAEQAEVDYINY